MSCKAMFNPHNASANSEMNTAKIRDAIYQIKMSSVLFYAALVLFKLILDFSYVKVIYPQYSYMGFSLNVDVMKIFAGYVLFFVLLILIPKSLDKASSILSLALFVMTYPPALTMFSFGGASWGFLAMNTVFWLVLLITTKLIPLIVLPKMNEKVSKALFLAIVFAICGYVIFFVIKTFGFNINLALSDVYERREVYKAASIPLSSYLFTWSANVILPMGFLYLIMAKRYLLSAFPLLSILLLFSATGMKSMLFTIPIVLVFALFLKIEKSSLWLALILVMLSVACLALFFWFDQIMPISLFTRRVFLVPAQISNFYYDFFKVEGQINLSHSIFGSFVPYRFETEPAKFMSRVFVGSESNFNTGIIADGFSNFGAIGVFCWAIFLSFIIRLLDSVCKGKARIAAMAGYIMFLSSLSNAALITNLGTHGMMVSLAMIYLLPCDAKEASKAHRRIITAKELQTK